MNIVLLALDREPAHAEKLLHAQYPQARLRILPLAAVSQGSKWQRLRALRALQPDLFAVSTERLAWQQGQNALLLFGALGGAHRVLIIDRHGDRREEKSKSVLLRAPRRFVQEAWLSRGTIRRAHHELARLEHCLAQGRVDRASNPQEKRSLHLAYLRTTPAAGTHSGGATTHTVGFIKGAVASGAAVSVISNDMIANLQELKVPTTVFGPEPQGLTRAAFDLRNGMLFTERTCAELVQQNPHFIYQRYSRFNWTGVEACLRTQRPLFLEYNGSEVWMARNWGSLQQSDLLERSERLNLAAATRVFVVAEVERENLIKTGVAGEKIVVNPNAVDVDEFRPGVGGGAIRRQLGINDTETFAGFIGTFGPWHGVLTLAEAIKLLPEHGIRFLLVGGGMYRDEVERIVQEAGRGHQVIFTRQVEHNQVPELLDACDVLLSPHVPMSDGSKFFGSPTKLFEYMAMGKAIVASRLGQIGQVLADQETALLVEPGHAGELADAIVRLSSSRELRERLGAAARRLAVERHTWRQNAQRVLDEYRAWEEGV